jgi:putative endonuclease
MAIHNELGKKGELLAVAYLQKKGYRILERNWRYLKAEIDIIALGKNTLVIAEVKTRSSTYFGLPQEFINSSKIKLLVSAANEYVISKNLGYEVRFDIISIVLQNGPAKIEHLKNGFLHF